MSRLSSCIGPIINTAFAQVKTEEVGEGYSRGMNGEAALPCLALRVNEINTNIGTNRLIRGRIKGD